MNQQIRWTLECPIPFPEWYSSDDEAKIPTLAELNQQEKLENEVRCYFLIAILGGTKVLQSSWLNFDPVKSGWLNGFNVLLLHLIPDDLWPLILGYLGPDLTLFVRRKILAHYDAVVIILVKPTTIEKSAVGKGY